MFFFLFFTKQNILSNNLEGGFRMRKNFSGQFFLLPNRIFDEWLIFIKKIKSCKQQKLFTAQILL